MQRLIHSLSSKTYGLSYGNGTRTATLALDEEPLVERRMPQERQHESINSCFGEVSLSPNPISLQGGLWLEPINTGPMQLIEAVICSIKGKVLVSKGFVLPQGKSSFFWSLDHTLWPGGTYELLIRSKKQLIRRRLTK